MSNESGVELTSREIAQLLETNATRDLEAIVALAPSDRAWLLQAICLGSFGSPAALLAGVRAQRRFLDKPFYAREHIKTLPCWVAVARSAPLAYCSPDTVPCASD